MIHDTKSEICTYICIYTNQMLSWLVISIALKSMKVNWDDDIPSIWGYKIHVPVTTNQLSICHSYNWLVVWNIFFLI